MKINHIKYCIAFLVFVSLQLNIQTLKAQSDTEKEIVYEFADIPASFKGDYLAYLSENVKYPNKAIENNIQGTIYLDIIIGKTGKVEDVTIRKNVGGGLGEEAARVVRGMPDWNPASQNGKPVRYKMTIPVKFILQDDTKKKKKRGSEEE